MKMVKEIVETYKTSRPIFKMDLSEDGRSIYAKTSDPVDKYRPENPDNCPIKEIVDDCYTERFSLDSRNFEINTNEIQNNAIYEIRSKIKTFLFKNLDMKNPPQSKVYKWAARNMPDNDEFNDVVISLYKYMYTITNADMSAKYSNKTECANIVALLEAMREKYDR